MIDSGELAAWYLGFYRYGLAYNREDFNKNVNLVVALHPVTLGVFLILNRFFSLANYGELCCPKKSTFEKCAVNSILGCF